MFFFFPPQLSLNPSGVRSIIAGEAIEARTHIAPRLTLRGRRGCSAAVIQWAAHPPPTHHHPARRAASLSQRHFCARQAGAAIHRGTDEQDPGSGNYRGVFGAENASLRCFYPPTRVFAKMNAGCLVLACSFLVGASVVR